MAIKINAYHTFHNIEDDDFVEVDFKKRYTWILHPELENRNLHDYEFALAETSRGLTVVKIDSWRKQKQHNLRSLFIQNNKHELRYIVALFKAKDIMQTNFQEPERYKLEDYLEEEGILKRNISEENEIEDIGLEM